MVSLTVPGSDTLLSVSDISAVRLRTPYGSLFFCMVTLATEKISLRRGDRPVKIKHHTLAHPRL